jgi:hypothetical protein
VLDLTQNFQPNNNYNLTFPGSPYAANTPGVSTTLLLGPDVDPKIVDSYNKQFVSTMFMMSLPKVERAGKEDIWFEQPYLIAPTVVRSPGVVETANPGTGTVTQVIPVTDACFTTVEIDHKLLYPDGKTHGIVIAKGGTAGSYTVTTRSYEGVALPALVAGDELGNSGPRNSDSQAMPTSTFRDSVVQYSNLMEDMGYFACGWDPRDSVEWDNKGTTDYKGRQIKNVTKRFFSSVMQTILTGAGGRTTTTQGKFSLSTKGLLKQQEDAGVSVTPVTTANCIAALREAIYDNQLDGQEEWVLAGPSRLLDKFSLGEKSERLRYKVGDNTYNTTLTRYEFFSGISVTPLAIDQMEDRGLYGQTLKDDLILFRKQDVKLTYMRNWPMFSNMIKFGNNQNTTNPSGFANIDLVAFYAFFGVRYERAWAGARFRMAA